MTDTVVSLPTGQDHPQLDFLVRAGEGLARGDDFFRQLLDVLPAAVYVTDAAGCITYYNEAAASLWGWRPELGNTEWCGSWKLFWPDGRAMEHGECPMAIAVKQGRPVHGMDAIAERPDGVRVPFMPFPTPLFDSSGRMIGAVNLLVDITDRKRAENAAQLLASIVESSDDAIISKDLNGIIMSWNAGAELLFGYSAEEAVGQPVTMLIPSDRVDEEPGILQRIRRGERVDHYDTLRRRKDGTLVNISLTVSPVKDARGMIVGASKIAHDISERKRAQEQERLLAGEMKHRIKNSLATVQALATQTLHSATGRRKTGVYRASARPRQCARSADSRKLGSGPTQLCRGAGVRGFPGRTPRAHRNRGVGWNLAQCEPGVTVGNGAARARHERGEIRGLVEWSWLREDFLGIRRPVQQSDTLLAGEWWSQRYTTGARRIWLAAHPGCDGGGVRPGTV